jgi:hypothetical protein
MRLAVARNGQPDRRNSWWALTIHWAIIQNHGMSRRPAMPPIPGRHGENASGQQVGCRPTFSIAAESRSCLFSCPGGENSWCVGTGSYVAGYPDGSGSKPPAFARLEPLVRQGARTPKDAAMHRHPTVFGTPPGRRVGQRRLHWHRPAPSGGPAHLPMMHRARRDPGLGSSRHPPASTPVLGWARRGPK